MRGLGKSQPSLAEQFAAAQLELAEAQAHYDRVRHDYFTDRCERVRAGLEVEPLAVANALAWEDQLAREDVARRNGEADRFAEAELRNINAENTLDAA